MAKGGKKILPVTVMDENSFTLGLSKGKLTLFYNNIGIEFYWVVILSPKLEVILVAIVFAGKRKDIEHLPSISGTGISCDSFCILKKHLSILQYRRLQNDEWHLRQLRM